MFNWNAFCKSIEFDGLPHYVEEREFACFHFLALKRISSEYFTTAAAAQTISPNCKLVLLSTLKEQKKKLENGEKNWLR